mmetsp:Transcript_3633/g.8766  ORF Transcript_3633/g.8766 Transcript_3633/m.8766 type:complete len:1555 (-) Transcript_3633:156-4820(-)
MTAQNDSSGSSGSDGGGESGETGPQNVLLLGVSFPDIKMTLEDRGLKESLLTHKDPTAEQSVELVRRGILTEMDARDHARCVETELAYDDKDVQVYTVSREVGGVYRKDRHIYANFNNSRTLCNQLQKSFGWNTKFQQVILDYYWMPTGWLVTRWAKSLFQNTLPDLVRHRLLECSAAGSTSTSTSSSSTSPTNSDEESEKPNEDATDDNDIDNNDETGNDQSDEQSKTEEENVPVEMEKGVVFLPFCAHVCKELVGAIKILRQYYTITFVKKSELAAHSLWKGTMRIDGDLMQHRLGKRLDQEEIYCTFNPTDIYKSMEDAHIRKDDVMTMLLSIDDYENIRMIRLKPLRQFSQTQNEPVVPEKGGFIGLDLAAGKKRLKELRNRKKAQKITVTVSRVDNDESDEYDWSTEEEEDSSDDSSSCYSSCDEDHLFVDGEMVDEEGEGDVFDPNDPENIPDMLQYYPSPALDVKSYTEPKELMDVDHFMEEWAKTWGPKAGRKSKKLDIMREGYLDFHRKGIERLSYNERMPPKQPDGVEQKGYKWVWEEGYGWKTLLVGEVPDLDEEPRIVNRATRDYNMQMTQALFEMKNPGYNVWSRTFGDGDHTSCYRISRRSVLLKTHASQGDDETGEDAGQSKGELSCNPREEKKQFKDAAESLLELAKYADRTKAVLSIDRLSLKKIEKMKGLELRYYLEAYGEKDIPRTLPQRKKMLIKVLGKYKAGKKSENSEPIDRVGSLAAILQEGVSAGDGDKDPNCESGLQSLLSVTAADRTSSLLREFADWAAKRPENEVFRNERVEVVVADDDYLEPLPPFKNTENRPHIRCNLRDHEDFPLELYRLLQQYKSLVGHIISWQEKGKSFKIFDEVAFEESILPQCNPCSLESSQLDYRLDLNAFKSTLRRFGFEAITEGPRAGGYHHDLFRRGEAREIRHIQPMFICGTFRDSQQPVRDPEDGESSGIGFQKPKIASPPSAVEDGTSSDDSQSADDEAPSPKTPIKKRKIAPTRHRKLAKASSSKLKPGAYNLSAPLAFQSELHRMLENAVIDGHDDAICWDSDGKSFCFPDRQLFVNKVLHRFSDMKSFKTFATKLYHQGFKSPNGLFFKDGFKRGRMPISKSTSPLPSPAKARSKSPTKNPSSDGTPADNTADDFISTLFALLGNARAKNVQSFMSWNSDGKSFTVHDMSRYDDLISPHFRSMVFTSFKRKLLHCFKFEKEGTFLPGKKVTLSHPNFIRGKKQQLKFVRNVRNKRRSCVEDVWVPKMKRRKTKHNGRFKPSQVKPPSNRSSTAETEKTDLNRKGRSTRTSVLASTPLTASPSSNTPLHHSDKGTPIKEELTRTSLHDFSSVQVTPASKDERVRKLSAEEYTDVARYDPIELQQLIKQPASRPFGLSFAVKLYKELVNPENRKIATFANHGRCFFVRDMEKLARRISSSARAPDCFLQALRQYGFRQIPDGNGEDSCGIFHPLFLRSRPGHVELMWRYKRGCKGTLELLPGDIIPDFSKMPFSDSDDCERIVNEPSEVSEGSEETTSNASETFSADEVFEEDASIVSISKS